MELLVVDQAFCAGLQPAEDLGGFDLGRCPRLGRLGPETVQGWVASAGQWRSLRVGRRTRVTRGSQSPAVPSGMTGRRRRGPKAEVPKALRGSRVASRVLWFCRMRLPEATLSEVWRLSSALAISMAAARGKG